MRAAGIFNPTAALNVYGWTQATAGGATGTFSRDSYEGGRFILYQVSGSGLCSRAAHVTRTAASSIRLICEACANEEVLRDPFKRERKTDLGPWDA